MVSLGKCSIMYGDHCPAAVQDEIKGILKYETTCFGNILGYRFYKVE
jgi:hypothetical protein